MTMFHNLRFFVYSRAQCAWQINRATRASLLLAVLLAISAQQVWGAQCSVSASGVIFGDYDVFSNQHLDSTGNIGVNCDISTSYTIALSPGGGSYAWRAMTRGAQTLNYNLYTDATRTSVWGDGTGGSATVNASSANGNHTVYGRIPARQNAYVGSYSDVITITLTF